jgi:hypothetical protein
MGNVSEASEYRPRLSIEITEEHRLALNRHLGGVHGLQKAVFHVIIEDLINLLDQPQGELFLAALLKRHISLEDVLRNNDSRDREG